MGFFNLSSSIGLPRTMADLYKPVAKKFTYSSVINRDIIERRVSDISELTGESVSNVIESILADSLLPLDEHARPYVNKVYFGKIQNMSTGAWEDYGIRSALAEIFFEISAGTNWGPLYTNSKPLVEFAHVLLKEHRPSLIKVPKNTIFEEMEELEYTFESVCTILESKANKMKEPELSAEARRARELILPSIRKSAVHPHKIIDVILQNWTALEMSTHTFRTLSYLFACCTKWEDSAANRTEFQNVCVLVMTEWSQEEAEKARIKQQEQTDSLLVRYPIANGDYVLAPRNWCPVNPSVAPFATNAGVISIKNGERYKAPHLLFFLDNQNVKNLSKEETEQITNRACKVWPELKKVIADKVELEYGPDGGITNMAEYSAAPLIGMFPLYDRGEHPLGEAPYGAEIVRTPREAEEEGCF